MPILNQSDSQRDNPAARRQDQIRVYMMDLWSFIPYYMARLCAALREESVDATLGSVRYRLDRNYFQQVGLTPDQSLIDVAGGIRSNFLRRPIKSLEYLANLFTLAIRLARSKPSILHVQYLPLLEHGTGLEIWFLKWVRGRGIRIVYTVHNVTYSNDPRRGLGLFRRAYHIADALICHGEEARSELVRNMGIAGDRIWLIPHGPLFEQGPQLSAQAARAKLGLEDHEPLVLFSGVISEYKGIPFLLDAWKKLKETGTAGKLLIAGTGDERVLVEISEKVAALELGGSVDLRLEFIPVEQLPLLYVAADILVYPYRGGTTSGALLTGLNYGKAVIATKLPFFQEYLQDGETAWLIDYGDTEALASAMCTLIQRPQQRMQLAAAVKRRAAQGIGWEEIARKTRECYETCCKG